MASGQDDNFAAIEGAAYERYLLDLMRGYAAETDRIDPNPSVLIKDIQLEGDGYPHTGFRIQTYHPRTGKTKSHLFTLYDNPGFYDEAGDRIVETNRIVGDILMLARGG